MARSGVLTAQQAKGWILLVCPGEALSLCLEYLQSIFMP